MENRKRARGRKRAQKRKAAKALLIVALVAAVFVLGIEVLSLGKADGGVFSRVSGYAHAAKAGIAKGKDGTGAKGKGGAEANGYGSAEAKAQDGPDAGEKGGLILVNRANGLPDGFCADLADIDGVQVARVLVDEFLEMREAAKMDGVDILIGSAYRSEAEQAQVFKEAVVAYIGEGFSESEAAQRASYTVAPPGHSEHETGLALDFSLAGDAEKQAEMWDWLSRNAHEYGFILRYPDGKGNITGCVYEPWHYRYVGKDHARAIYGQGLVLEEYLGADPVRLPRIDAQGHGGSPGGSSPGTLAG